MEEHIDRHWKDVQFGALNVTAQDGGQAFEVEVCLAGLIELRTGRTVRRAAERGAGIPARDAFERTPGSQFRVALVFDTNASHWRCDRFHAALSAGPCAGTVDGNSADRLVKVSNIMSLRDIIPILQIAIGPVILVSGVSLLLLSMTNRFAHAQRPDAAAQTRTPGCRRARWERGSQMQILLRRAHIIRAAITLSALSILLAAVLIIVLFIFVTLQIGWAGPIIVLFIL